MVVDIFSIHFLLILNAGGWVIYIDDVYVSFFQHVFPQSFRYH